MEIRVLKYFLAVASEGNITLAAEKLHITQPTLSRQLAALEEELGTKLFERGTKNISLTDVGKLLQKRAADILTLVDNTVNDIHSGKRTVVGDVFVGSGQTTSLDLIAQVSNIMRGTYPEVRLNLVYGDAPELISKLERGMLDFAFIGGSFDRKLFNFTPPLPSRDQWGILVSDNHPLSALHKVHPFDIKHIPMMLTRQMLMNNSLSGWLGFPTDRLNIVGTFDIAHMVTPSVRLGHCAAIALRRNGEHAFGDGIIFIPFSPAIELTNTLAWGKNRPLSEAAQAFLDCTMGILGKEADAQQET